MTLTDLASIGTLASAAAVLVSLICLNLQTRLAAHNQQSLMQHGRTQQLSDWLQYIAQPEIAEVMLDDRQYQATLGSLRFQCSLPGFRAN
jgi:hypothetical protein